MARSKKASASLALFLSLNILFFSLVSGCGSCPGGGGKGGSGGGGGRGGGGGGRGGGGGGGRGGGGGSGGGGSGGGGSGGGGSGGSGGGGGTPSPSTGGGGSGGGGSGGGGGTATCPRDALKLGVCANVLGGLINATIGSPPVTPCCTLIQGLADLEAAVCLCTAIRANILGINLNIPISLSLLLNVCSRNAPRGFQCS
ncbi:uncharacterized protein LOC133778221 [Humulus lupulus]|uniref:uncharacterized protein LOC133778221 n=1 Tax=Humulus lupulus TaxID=3486 RepID=UPI002B4008BC|nr:uncharacterized protein LOC133778221 [Humulus lupulus]